MALKKIRIFDMMDDRSRLAASRRWPKEHDSTDAARPWPSYRPTRTVHDFLVPRSEKCLKEIDLVQSLQHPHIIEYVESFIEEDQLHLVFEYAEAGDLKR